MTTREIVATFKELYDAEVSASLQSNRSNHGAGKGMANKTIGSGVSDSLSGLHRY